MLLVAIAATLAFAIVAIIAEYRFNAGADQFRSQLLYRKAIAANRQRHNNRMRELHARQRYYRNRTDVLQKR
jgi:hypothetical protein